MSNRYRAKMSAVALAAVALLGAAPGISGASPLQVDGTRSAAEAPPRAPVRLGVCIPMHVPEGTEVDNQNNVRLYFYQNDRCKAPAAFVVEPFTKRDTPTWADSYWIEPLWP
ncbi:hypothetical protein ACWEFJ_27385 [Actinosynnema sp. NPDC004786]